VGRALMYTALVALTTFVLSAYFLLEHGGGKIAAVQEVSLHNLTLSPHNYEGEVVSTRGRLVHNDDLNVYEIGAPDENYPVVIRTLDERVLASLVGQEVIVTGLCGFESGVGVYIEADSVRPAASLAPGA
jgi:hypothetical protein